MVNSAWLKSKSFATHASTAYLAAFNLSATACKSLTLMPAICVAFSVLPATKARKASVISGKSSALQAA